VRRTLYWKRLLIVVAAAAVFCGTVFAVHRFQVKSQSSILKEQAMKAAGEVEANPARRKDAIELLQKYIKFRPGDEEAFRTYANLHFDEVKAGPTPANMEAAARGGEEFLRAFPNNPEERRRIVELYLSTGQFSKLPLAKQHLEMLFGAPNSPYRANVDVLEMAAECESGLNNLPGAIAHLDAAIKTNTAPVRVYLRIMEFHYANRNDPKRNTYIEDYLRALRTGRFERDLEARLAAARFEMFLDNAGGAAKDVNFAFEQLGGAANPDALLVKAELELKAIKKPEEWKAQYAKAEKLLREAYELDKKSAKRNVAIGMLLAEVLALTGKRDEGIQILRETAAAIDKVNDQFLLILDRLIDLGEKELSATLIDTRLAPEEGRKMLTLYFRGRLAVLNKDWMGAVKMLDEAAPSLVRVPLYHKKAMVGLAACYAAMQNPDKQLEYCRLALRDDGGYPLAIVGEAEALVRMGKFDEALKRYRAIVYTFQIPGYRAELARLELLDVLGQLVAPETRNWTRFEESLGPVDLRTPELHVLNADSLVARARAAEATKVIEDWIAKNPGQDPNAAMMWVALARVKDGGKVDTAWGVLAEAEKKVGDRVEIRLAKSGLLVVRAKPVTAPELEALGVVEPPEKFPKDEKFRLYFGLGQAAARVADRNPNDEASKPLRDLSLKFLQAAAALSPRDLTARAYLLDQGLAAGRMDLVEQALKEMAAVEGPDGPVGSLGRIAVRLPIVAKMTDPAAREAGLRELRELAENVKRLRPGWSRVYIALAKIEETAGLFDAALAYYTEALEKGDRQEFVIRRAVDLYRLKQQDEKAIGLLNKLSTEVRLPDDLERYRSIYKMLASDVPKESRPTIDRIAPETSTDYRILLLRGSLLAAIREDADAEKAFRLAVAKADRRPEVWASLVAQLIKVGKVDDAKRAVAEAERKLNEAKPEKAEDRAELSLALGGLYEMIGDPKTALAYYDAACKDAPTELNPARQRILFFQRAGQMEKAYDLLKEVTNSSAQNIARWARRHLAITMMSRSDSYSLRTEALKLVERNLADSPNDPDDLKARAVIWTVDPVTREEGIRQLRQFGDRGELTPDEFYLLGQLAFDQGKYTEAEKYFKLAARVRPGVTAHHMAAVVRVYLAIGRVDLAENAAERLKTYNPSSWEAAREESRVLHRKSKIAAAAGELEEEKKLKEKARAVILAYPKWKEVANLATRTGPLFEELGFNADAKGAYQAFMDADKSPSAHLYLARFYIVTKQPEEAIKLARQREKEAPALLTARLLTGAVRAKRPGPAAEAEIEKWLDEALRAAGKPELEAGLLGAKAELLDAQGEYDKAIATYEQSIAKSKSDLVVNNLCMLLALWRPDRADEAVKLMTEMIAIRGPVPSFLDTRAVAHLVKGDPAAAKKDLEMALVQYDRAAYRFHLAWALDLDGEPTRRILAVDELKAAKRLGLVPGDLHPQEQKRYNELLAKYRLDP
jgi:tetratricopeptide (TPR) repeat protein